MSKLDPNRTPATVVGAVAAGTVVVPFLIVYSFLFIVHGAFVQPDQPDITSSRGGELVAGLVALAFLLLVLWGMGRLHNGYDRWVFLLGQLITAGAALDLLLDSSSGEPQIPAVVLIAALAALVLAVLPPSWLWVATRGGQYVPPAPYDSPAAPSDSPAAPSDQADQTGRAEPSAGRPS